jgi:hypothetical protein
MRKAIQPLSWRVTLVRFIKSLAVTI